MDNLNDNLNFDREKVIRIKYDAFEYLVLSLCEDWLTMNAEIERLNNSLNRAHLDVAHYLAEIACIKQ